LVVLGSGISVAAQSDELQTASQSVLAFKSQLTAWRLMSSAIIHEVNAMQVAIKAAHNLIVRDKPTFLIEQAISNAIDENTFVFGFKLPTLQSFLNDPISTEADSLADSDDLIDTIVENGELTLNQGNLVKQKLDEVSAVVSFLLESLLVDELIAKLSTDAAQSASTDCTSVADDPSTCSSVEAALTFAREASVDNADNATADAFLSRARVIAREFLREMNQLERRRSEILKRIRSVCLILERALANASSETPDGISLAVVPVSARQFLSLDGRVFSLAATKGLPNGVYWAVVPIRGPNGKILGQEIKKFALTR
jgi:hypothetical protein